MTINGAILVGSEERQRPGGYRAVNPATGEAFGPEVSEANSDDVADACALASSAAGLLADVAPQDRAAFIEAVAEAILAIGDVLIDTAVQETGLPRRRIEGERMRTVNQLRLFASEVRRGEFLDVTIDTPLPDRAPSRPDLRRVNVPLGPVAVFGASNFPLAFSVAGGDTTSAFAAGCPVVVKGHPAHPGTGELVARAILAAVSSCGLPEGVFSFLPGRGNALGGALVADPRIKAVGFTGSRGGGLALCRIAADRPEPIPVYAEMSSINPVVLMPAALDARAEALGSAFIGSLTLGAGQFCTNPGLVLAVDIPALERFVSSAKAALEQAEPPVMLTPDIHRSYAQGVSELGGHASVTHVASGRDDAAPNRCSAALFSVSATDFLTHRALGQEIFGASSVIVRCADVAELVRVIDALEGQLTATLQIEAADGEDGATVLRHLAAKVGRVLADGWPTGVEVTWAMVHGGPFPATSDSRTTSVGTLALERFLRPICYQDIRQDLLPPALQDANPWRLPRRVDGEWQR